MAEPTNWAELKAEVESWLIRDDLTALVPNFICYAERRFNREIFTPDREGTDTLSATSETVALPTDLWALKAVWLDTDPKVVLDPMPLDELRQAYSAATTGKPCNYALAGSDMILGPAPDATYSVKVFYWEAIPALGASQATNWLLTKHPDLYVAGALVESFLYVRDEAQAAYWAAKTANIIESITRQGLRRAHPGPVRLRSAVVI